jgi:transcriptional regulator with XRE-family HTH domain
MSDMSCSDVMAQYRDNRPDIARDNRRLTALRRVPYNFDMRQKFRTALLSALDATGESLSHVAKETGVSYEQLKKLKQRDTGSTNVDDAVLIANHFGMSLDEFIGDDTQAHRNEIVDLYSRLSDGERALLLAAARGFASGDQKAS